MDELEMIEKNAAPSSQAVLYRPAPTVEERRAAGLAARETCPIASLGAWEPRESSEPAIDLIEQQSATRDPGLVPLRYERMGVSPFTFYRGSAVIMAADLATMPVTGLEVATAAYLGDGHAFEDAMWEFARAYADQNEADYQVFIERVGQHANA